MTGATVRLAAVLGCVALAASRLGLVAHELAGHGGAVTVLGGTVAAVRLFWFAGGWVSYHVETSEAGLLAIALAGMATEAVIGGVLWLTVSGRTLGARLVRAAGGAAIVHAGTSRPGPGTATATARCCTATSATRAGRSPWPPAWSRA
jgi:hypothetical protein